MPHRYVSRLFLAPSTSTIQKYIPGIRSDVVEDETPLGSCQTRQMGRRKSKRKPPPKKKMTGNLDTQFTCPFCNHEKSCDVKMERTRNTGIISCSVCLEEFQTPITYLSEPVDVYSDWIDACEAANQ
ncbi:transcription elongation factor 1 homolog [Nerophis lumbriciformis]|uniref:transcription elongation factor 1 homolog n=1 Tax=Nerophis lumbriciformis TaxID=546530 RepID=UPI002ADF70CE|nr:transcription elongation factor 1 homolog [Nerophis lumbriciformis]